MALFGIPWEMAGSPVFGLGANLLGGWHQAQINEQNRQQGLGWLDQMGMGDVGNLPYQAGHLNRQLGGQSINARDLLRGSLSRQLGVGSSLQSDLRGLPGQFGMANQGILGQFGQQAGGITGQFQTGAEGLRGQFGTGAQGLRSQFGAGAAGITGGYGNRLGTALGMLQGAGRQASEDISTRFRESLGNQQQALRQRGFGGTMAANIAQGSATQESAEQRRLQEQLRQQSVGMFTDLSGQGLAARERLLGAGTGLGQGLLGTGTQLGQGLLGAGTNLQAGFAGQQLQAGQAGQQFLGGMNLDALAQRGQLGQFLQQQQGDILQQDLANRFSFGQYPIGIQQQLGGQAFGMLGVPQQLNYAQIQPYGGGG